jgi:hypothetical protein
MESGSLKVWNEHYVRQCPLSEVHLKDITLQQLALFLSSDK